MRTCTYIAADFDHDKAAVDHLHWLKDNKYLFFQDAHELQQSSDTSLPCSIKRSLRYRMDNSRKFILIVGDQTNKVTKGGCQLCNSYNSHTNYCGRGYWVDYRSYLRFECDIATAAISEGMKIIVLYNSGTINRALCPEKVRWIGIHRQMWYRGTDGSNYWDNMGIIQAVGL